MKIFCYGSNMNTLRITERCSGANFISAAKVIGWKLAFNKRSKDGSGKANLISAGDDSQVWGVIFDISNEQKPLLDKAEGLGKGYDQHELVVINDLEQEIRCLCYISTDEKYLDNNLKPFNWYKEMCIFGAKEHNLPPDYILLLEKVRVS